MKNTILFSLFFAGGIIYSQERVNQAALQQISREENEKFTQAQKLIRVDQNLKKKLSGFDGFYEGIIEGIPRYLSTSDSRQLKITNADYLHDASTVPGGNVLKGTGMKVYIWDGGRVMETHQDILGRVTNKEDPSVALSAHSLAVGGIIMASGNSLNYTIGGNPTRVKSNGVAPEASLLSYDYADNFSEIARESANNENLPYMISNHSYGYVVGWRYNAPMWYWYSYPSLSENESPLFGHYSGADKTFDQIAYNAPQHTIISSAGNTRGDGPDEGVSHYTWDDSANWVLSNVQRPKNCGITGYDCLPYGAVAKNIIVVGSTDPIEGERYTGTSTVQASNFSSFGPTDDGRIKPDIAAPGASILVLGLTSDTSYAAGSGTSYSSPIVSGISLLMQQLYNQKYPGKYLRSDMLKAILLHTANEAGNAPGPDYSYGWGLVNAVEATEVIVDNGTTSVLKDNVLAQGEVYELKVKAIGEGTPLKATIVWLDPPAEPLPLKLNDRTPRLINDLDLRIADESGEALPWKLDPESPGAAATKGDNILDNVEQVLIDAPEKEKTYTIKVSHKGTLATSNQQYALVITGGVELGLSVEETISKGEQISVYPNPVSDKLTIRSGEELKNAKVKLINVSGQVVLDEGIKLLSPGASLDVSGYSPGIYLLYIQSDKGTFTKKVIKK